MNKRIRRKVHKRCLCEVVYGISVTSEWRKRLFESTNGTKFKIDRQSIIKAKVPKALQYVVCRYGLRFYVSAIVEEEIPGWEGYPGCIMFKFAVVEFPDIYDYSANNPEVI